MARAAPSFSQAAHFSADRQAPEITTQMSETFERLFLDGHGDALPAVSTIALYREFQELTPTGDKGNEMIRKLADRLVEVDLLDDAAALLIALEPDDIEELENLKSDLTRYQNSGSCPNQIKTVIGEAADKLATVVNGATDDPDETIVEIGRLIEAAMKALDGPPPVAATGHWWPKATRHRPRPGSTDWLRGMLVAPG